MDFDLLLAQVQDRIALHARTQRIPGLDQDEVLQELLETLWKASTTYDPNFNTNIEQWWWVLWTRRKADLVDSFFAAKRLYERPIPDDELHGLIDSLDPSSHFPIPACPIPDPLAVQVWYLIARGYRGTEIRYLLGISVRKFYAVMEQFNTPDVREELAA